MDVHPRYEDLFGQIPVTWPEIYEWVEVVARFERGSWRAHHYIKYWDVAGKIREAKRAGEFPPVPIGIEIPDTWTLPPPPYVRQEGLPTVITEAYDDGVTRLSYLSRTVLTQVLPKAIDRPPRPRPSARRLQLSRAERARAESLSRATWKLWAARSSTRKLRRLGKTAIATKMPALRSSRLTTIAPARLNAQR